MKRSRHNEHHRVDRIGWLRAAVLGANDGIISTGSLLIGVASANADQHALLIAGVAGLVAGAMSMAAGEYVSVHSQADAEQADLDRERGELAEDPAGERRELASIYVSRGLDRELGKQVAEQLMAHDALGAHARDELGISKSQAANPIQAALASAASFAIGAALPLIIVLLSSAAHRIIWLAVMSLLFLAALGVTAARIGGADMLKSAWRVTFWGALAFAFTAGIGALFKTAV